MGELVQLPFRSGVDEGTDPKQVPPGGLLSGVNIRQDKAGRVRKKLGTQQLAKTAVSGSNVSTALRLLPRGDSLSLTDDTEAVAYVEALSKWQRIDRVPVLTSTVRPLADTTRSTSQATQAAYGDLLIQVYSTATATLANGPANGAIYVQVEDSARGVRVLRPTLVDASARMPRVFVDGTTAYILYVTAANTLTRKALSLTTLSLGSAGAITTNVVTWDGVMRSSVAYLAIAKAAGLTAERWSLATPGQLHTASVAGAATYSAVGIDAAVGGNCLVIYSTSAPTVRVATLLASDLSGLVGPTQVDNVQAYAASVLRVDGTTMLVAYTPLTANLALYTMTFSVNQAAHTIGSGSTRRTYHVALASHLFALGSRYYFMGTVTIIPPAIATSNDTTISPISTVIAEVETSNSPTFTAPHRRAGVLESRTGAFEFGWVTQVAEDSAGRMHIATLRKQREPVGTESPPTGATVHAIEEAGDDWGRPLPIGSSVLVPGSAAFMFDGAAAYPYGFVHEPVILDTADAGAGTGTMVAGDYVYACVYEWRDANGVLHRSAPSAQVRVNVAANTSSVELTIACTGIDAKQSLNTGVGSSSTSPVRIAVYRTEVDGTVLYRLTHEPDYNVQHNDPTAESVTFTDAKGDSSIAGSGPVIALSTRPQLYTSQELEEVNPSASVTGIIHRGRAWLLAGDRRTLQATKEFEEDPELAPGMNEILTLLFDRPKYALGSLDDKLIAFDEQGLDAVYGDGPDSLGNNNDWQIVRVQSDVGCTNPKSITTAPFGVVFESAGRRGLALLGRDLTVTHISSPVEDTLEAYPVITSAVVVPEENEVRWTCNAADGATGIVVVFNYAMRAWYTRTYLYTPFIDAALIDGVYSLLESDGTVWRETDSTFLDADEYVEMSVSVPVYPAGPVGWHRLRSVQVVGKSMTHHRLNVAISRDFASSAEQLKTFEDGSAVTTPGDLEQARVTLQHQKRQAAVVTIYDQRPTIPDPNDGDALLYDPGTGEGPILEMLALHIERKEGPAKLPAGKRG